MTGQRQRYADTAPQIIPVRRVLWAHASTFRLCAMLCPHSAGGYWGSLSRTCLSPFGSGSPARVATFATTRRRRAGGGWISPSP